MPLALLLAAQLTYYVPPLGDDMREPSPLALELADAPFEDVRLGVAFTGSAQRFARLRYGEADSVRVTAVIDANDSGDVALYLDQNRDLSITEDERVTPTEANDRAWEVSLAAMVRGEQSELGAAPRRLRFELNGQGSILTVATLGWLEGEVVVGERSLPARRRDLDANGFFGDQPDQLWIDRNCDGEWAAFGELYTSLPFLTLPEPEGRVRYVLKSSREGQQLALLEASGTGTLEVALRRTTRGATRGATRGDSSQEREVRRDVRSLQALFVGRDGSAVTVTQHARPTEVASGDYRLTLLAMEFAAEDSDQTHWTFLFSEAFRPTGASWRRVEAGAALCLDPVGAALSLELHLPETVVAVTGGDRLRAQPYLYVGKDRLLIRSAHRGPQRGAGFVAGRAKVTAQVSLRGDGPHPLVIESPGFL